MAGERQNKPNILLRRARTQRSWTQQDLADAIGTTPLNVSRWERGITSPSPYFRQKLCDVFKKSLEELDLVPSGEQDSAAASTARRDEALTRPSAQVEAAGLWNVPYRRNPFFTGREDVLAHLREALSGARQPVALSQPQAISGLGGIGKTQTAVEYANRYREAYQAVFWARAESQHLITSDFLTIASLLNLPQRFDQHQDSIVQAVMRWLDSHEGWLLILDNVDDLQVAADFIPSASLGHVLLTTRAHALGTLARRIDLEKMSLEESTVFLLRRIQQQTQYASTEHIPEAFHSQAGAIAAAMDGLPLALDQAGAFIEETGCSMDDYMKFFQTQHRQLLRRRGRYAGGHPEPVATTLTMAFEKVERSNLAAAELLRLCAFLHPDVIPQRAILEGASELEPALHAAAMDEMAWNEAIGELHKYSLIKRDAEAKSLNIHRLVQAVIKDDMTEEAQRTLAAQVVRMMSKVYPEVEFATWSLCQLYLPQVSTCLEHVRQWTVALLEAAGLFHRAGTYLYERGQYAESEQLLRQALEIREQMLEDLHAERADSLNALGILFYALGRYEQAETLLQRALTIREQTLGVDHPDVTGSLDGLGWLYKTLGQYERAESLLKRSLTILEQAHGPRHPRVAESLNELGVLYNDQGKYEEAEVFYLRSRSIIEQALEQTLDSHHPFFAGILNNLAVLYRKQGKLQQAEPLMQQALVIQEEIFGPDHPNVATALNNLAMLYDAAGAYVQAEPLMLRAIAIRERVLGPTHLSVATALNNLVRIYLNQGQDDLVEPIYQRILSTRQHILGPEHPLTLQTLADIANFHSKQELSS